MTTQNSTILMNNYTFDFLEERTITQNKHVPHIAPFHFNTDDSMMKTSEDIEVVIQRLYNMMYFSSLVTQTKTEEKDKGKKKIKN